MSAIPKDNLKEKLWITRVLVVIGGALYPAWTAIHHLVSPNVTDSVIERLAVYFAMLGLLAVSYGIKASDESKLEVLRLSRWIMITHYFTVVARNNISIQYAIGGYFLLFILASLIETRRAYVLFSLYVVTLSFFCGEGTTDLPGYSFRLGIATCLLICYIGLAGKLKLLESLQSSEALFRSMFQNSVVGMMAVDTDGKVSMVNQTLVSILGLESDNLIGHQVDEWLSPECKTASGNTIRSFLKGKSDTLLIETQYVAADGHVVWMRVAGSLIKSADRKNFGLLLLENISQQKVAEFMVSAQKEAMAHSSKMTALGEMAGGIAHEINTPLTTITLSADNLLAKAQEKTLSNEEAAQAAEMILSTTSRVSKIIQGLKKFSRAGGTDDLSPVKLREIVNDTIDLCHESLKNKGIELRVAHIPDDILIACRPVEISQVLLNLLNNAKDAVTDLKTRWIAIDINSFGNDVKIEISDSGPGIPPEIRNKIFQPFFTTKPIGSGTGLGLSISTGIILAHGGKLEYDRNSSVCKFIVQLPKVAESKAA